MKEGFKLETVRKERKLLKKLIKVSKNYSNGDIPVSHPLIDDNNYYFQQLTHKELVSVSKAKDVDTLNWVPTAYAVTELGQHFFEKRHEVSKELMLKSFWFPLAVAFLTSLLTNGVLYGIKLLR